MGQPYPDLQAARVLGPLGMTASSPFTNAGTFDRRWSAQREGAELFALLFHYLRALPRLTDGALRFHVRRGADLAPRADGRPPPRPGPAEAAAADAPPP